MTHLLIIIYLLTVPTDGQLTINDAQMLIENTQDFLEAKSRNRCPQAEVLWSGERDIGFQIRNRCTKSPSGLIGNYVVDRRTAAVWVGIDRDQLVQSKRLRDLQRALLKRIRDGQERKD